MMKRILTLMPVTAALLAVLFSTAGAAVVVGEDFSGSVTGKRHTLGKDTPRGTGWRPALAGDIDLKDAPDYLEIPVAGKLRPNAGTIEFEAVRDSRGEHVEAFFTLLGEAGENLLVFRIWWDGLRGYGQRQFVSIIDEEGLGDLWIGVDDRADAEVPAPIAPGARFHVAMNWDGAGGGVFVNGVKLGLKAAASFDLADRVRRTASIAIGSQPYVRLGYAQSQAQSVITDFYVYDEKIDGLALYTDPARYRLGGQLEVASVEHDGFRKAGFSGKLVAGTAVGVTVTGTPGATGTFDILHYPDLGGKIELDWRGWGVYLEEKTFFDPGEVDLREVEGYEVFAAKAAFDPAKPGIEPVARLEVEEQAYTLELLDVDQPYFVAVVALMRGGARRTVVAPIAGRALAETSAGVYEGFYEVGWQDRYPRSVVVGRLSRSGESATLAGEQTLALDPSLKISVTTTPQELPADEKTEAKVSVFVTDANGKAVADHEVKFLLATTSQYTGVVGGGAFKDQTGARLTESTWGRTDLFGKLEATYTAGFAAKTAIIVARDMLSNSTGVGYVKTFIRATAELDLTPTTEALTAGGFEIALSSSDSWLTADGQSQARITATVSQFGNPVEGRTVAFSVTSGTGKIRTVSATTDRSGNARAVYTAGKKIGIVLITATDVAAGVSASLQIELRSDAPAKIAVNVDPASLPADGRSRADIKVVVTDINDNPNDNVEVEYALAGGSGSLRSDREVTDRNGESSTQYVAGRTPGTVTFEITVRSTLPTMDETEAARGLAVAVKDFKFF